ncbi:MAG: DinB family protein [Ktedonobacterales bacterium]
MAEDNFTLTTFYSSWNEYQDHITEALAPLTAEQLALRAAPGLRSIGENAMHIIGCRVYWLTEFLGEDGGEEVKAVYASWNEVALALGTPVPTAAELVQGLDRTWQFLADCLARWSPADMQQTFADEVDGAAVELSRAWVVWHVLEHDLHHGGEVSLTLGMHGLRAEFAI